MIYLIKEWKELSRGKGLWLSIMMILFISIFVLLETRTLPSEYGFTIFLLSLYEMNLFFIPLIGLFISSFSLMQEKELKTLMMLTTKKESYASFLLKKSIAIHAITLGIFISIFLIVAILTKFSFSLHPAHFLYFLAAVSILLIIFNQIGLFLGSVCQNRMQLIGANIFTWFFFLYLVDSVFLYFLPDIHFENVKLFSFFFFLDPIHANQFFLDTALDVFSLEHMSRLMENMVWTSPTIFLILNVLIWVLLSFGASILWGSKVKTR